MRREDFTYHLPEALIAQEPLAERSASRLLVLDGASGRWRDAHVRDLPELLAPGDLVVFNDTRVIPARLYGTKASGGRIEVLLERALDDRRVLAHLRASKAPAPGQTLHLDGGASALVGERRPGGLVELTFDRPALAHFEAHGHVPLPPYIDRPDDAADRERYQTVFARSPGAVAAPTAGLHFDDALLAALDARGIERQSLTLHVGAGTFQPVRAERVDEHVMHEERVIVPEAVCAAVARCRRDGGRVVAIGTTVVRALESATDETGTVRPGTLETQLFIYPGAHRFRCVDLMFTNFHLPESTLLMLVSAFAGREAVLAAYRHAVNERYRFFSYGDAMLITPLASQRIVAPPSRGSGAGAGQEVPPTPPGGGDATP